MTIDPPTTKAGRLQEASYFLRDHAACLKRQADAKRSGWRRLLRRPWDGNLIAEAYRCEWYADLLSLYADAEAVHP